MTDALDSWTPLMHTEAFAQALLTQEHRVLAWLRAPMGLDDQHECHRLLGLIGFHQRTLVEFECVEGQALRAEHPAIHHDWQVELSWFLDHLSELGAPPLPLDGPSGLPSGEAPAPWMDAPEHG